ncbi:transglycosylase domain-containing protein [Neptuniibacter sp. QD34_54]|uniref:transglycosylase domain-containing protein n=1 Tax=Neptuniibacter sp. QD34_54 TaxID=3398208 RepID=UPI0039F504CF
MKLVKRIYLFLAGIVIFAFVSLEGYYHYSALHLDPQKIQNDTLSSQVVFDALWVSLGESGDIRFESITATEYALKFLYTTNSDHPRYIKTSNAGLLLASQVSRLLALNSPKLRDRGHIAGVVTTIWLSRNSEVFQLLEFVARKSYFGHNHFGLDAASEYYFEKRASELNSNEVVSLISIIRSPSMYDPHCHPQRFKERALKIFYQLQVNWPDKYAAETYTTPIFEIMSGKECSQNHKN